MASVASIVVTEDQVLQFLDTLLGKPVSTVQSYEDRAPAAASETVQAPNPWMALGQAAASVTASTSGVPLRLHPRVDAVHPLGEARSSAELENALRLYRQMVKDVRFEVNDIMVGPDKAVVTGHQIASSHAAALASQMPWHTLPPQLQHAAHDFLPSLRDGRVPTTIQLRFGKNDAGDPVVTQMAVNFSLLSVLMPHLALQPWQQQVMQQMQQPLLQVLVSAGSLASTLEDVGVSLSATWRATAAVLQATVGKLVSEVQERLQEAAVARAQRAGSGELNGGHH